MCSNYFGRRCYKQIQLTFDALEVFECHTYDELVFIIDFVRRNPSINKIKLSFFGDCLTRDTIAEMKNVFTFAKEIEIDLLLRTNLSEEISSLLNSLKSLQKLILRHTYIYTFENLSKLILLLPHIPWILDEKSETITYNKIN